MQYEVTGKVLEVFQAESGNGKNGPWAKMQFLIETIENYPQKMLIDIWNTERNPRIDQFGGLLQPKAEITVSFTAAAAQSRKTGKWFNSLTAFYIRPAAAATNTAAEPTEEVTDPETLDQVRAKLIQQYGGEKK